MTGSAPSSSGFWEKAIPPLTAISLSITPMAVAFMAYEANSSSTSKDYVSLAISILNSKDSPAPSRKWAAQLLSELSPVTVPIEMNQGLAAGKELGGKPTEFRAVEVKIPIAMPCMDKKMVATMKSARPAPTVKVLEETPPDKRQKALLSQMIKLESYAKMADIVMDGCSKVEPLK